MTARSLPEDAGRCDLCREPGAVRRLTAWSPDAERAHGRAFDLVDRCAADAACRARVESRGEPWPVIERTRRRQHR